MSRGTRDLLRENSGGHWKAAGGTAVPTPPQPFGAAAGGLTGDQYVSILKKRLDEQRAELEHRTDAINAIQRNFESLSSMYSSEKNSFKDAFDKLQRAEAEIERLRTEVKINKVSRVELLRLQDEHEEYKKHAKEEFAEMTKELERLKVERDEQHELVGAVRKSLSAESSKAKRLDLELTNAVAAVYKAENEMKVVVDNVALALRNASVPDPSSLLPSTRRDTNDPEELSNALPLASRLSAMGEVLAALSAKGLPTVQRVLLTLADQVGSLQRRLETESACEKRKNSEWGDERRQLLEKIDRLENELLDLRASSGNLTRKIAAQAMKSSQESQRTAQLDAALAQSKDEVASLSRKLEETSKALQLKTAEFESAVAQKDATIADLQGEVDKARKQRADQEARFKSLLESFTREREEEHAKQQAIDRRLQERLREEVDGRAAATSQLTEKLEAERERAKERERELEARLASERAASAKRLEELDRLYKAKEFDLEQILDKEAQSERERQRERAREREAETARLECELREKERLVREREEMAKQLEARQRDVEQLRAALNDAQSKAAKARDEASRLGRDLSKERMEKVDALQKLAVEKECIVREVVEEEAQKQRELNEAVNRLTSERDSLHDLLVQSKQERIAVQKECEEMAYKLQRLQDELQCAKDERNAATVDLSEARERSEAAMRKLQDTLRELDECRHEMLRIPDLQLKLEKAEKEEKACRAAMERALGEADVLRKKEAEVSETLRIIQDVQRETAKAIKKLIKAEEACESGYSCMSCLDLLKQPTLSIPCGHTFCSACFDGGKKANGMMWCAECESYTVERTVPLKTLELLCGKFMYRKQVLADLHSALNREQSRREDAEHRASIS